VLHSGVTQNSGVGHKHRIFDFKNSLIYQINLNMPITYRDIEEEVKKTIDYLLKQNYPNIRAAARKFGVLRNRL
jgi:hypothetical protein